MILQLNVQRLEPGVYAFHCADAPDSPSTHNTIAEGFRFYGNDIPPEIATFVNIEYGGCQLETTPVSELESKAEALAQRLMQLVARLHEAAAHRGQYCA
jgi:hypothetical protein